MSLSIIKVWVVRKFLVCIVELILSLRKIVMMFISFFCVVLFSFFMILFFLKRLFIMSIFISGVVFGMRSLMMIMEIIGKSIFFFFDMGFNCFMCIFFFLGFVRVLMIGG